MGSPALALARTAGRLSRRLGRGGGTSLPGKILLRLQPDAVGDLGAGLPRGAGIISATNGKTTTSRLAAAALRAEGWPLVANPAGANLMSGVATALVEGVTRRPSPVAALFEVDEAALVEVARQLRPRVVVLMNLFRDQLDRYGELDRLVDDWVRMIDGLDVGTRLVLNADDPAVASLARRGDDVVFFGVDDTAAALPGLPHAADSTRCWNCSAALDYSAVLVGHLGHWACPDCGLRRPEPDVRATSVTLHGATGIAVRVDTPSGAVEVEVPLPGLHNAYNVTAAVATAAAFGVRLERIGPALRGARAAFGRAERITVDGREVVMLLAKNPAGANETVRTILLDPSPLDVLVSLNDRTADGNDVSWVWDVDFEPLRGRLASLTVTGDRAYDLALRFRYGGFPGELVQVIPDPRRALDAALARGDRRAPLYVLPTYTAMIELREILVRRGAAERFWRDG